MLDKLNWIVIPGGPGLSKKYLEKGISNAFTGYKLHFYNPLGSPELPVETVPTIDELTNQIINKVKELQLTKFGLITHSFGNYLAMRLIENSKVMPTSIIMISPMPFQFNIWKKALNNIINKIPEQGMKKIETLMQNDKKGCELFRALLPYYAYKKVDVPDILFDVNMCNRISENVSCYDDRALILSRNISVACIFGDKDPFYLDHDFLSNRKLVIENIGHYPFLEDEIIFSNVVNNAIKKVNEKL